MGSAENIIGEKNDPGVTPNICGTDGVRTLGVGNSSHPQRLKVHKVRPCALRSSYYEESIMLKNTSFGVVS